MHIQPIVNKTRKRRRKRRVKKVKDVSEWGVEHCYRVKEFTDDYDGARRVITDVVFSHEDDVHYALSIL